MTNVLYWIAEKFLYFFTNPRYKKTKDIIKQADANHQFVFTVAVPIDSTGEAITALNKALNEAGISKDSRISDLYA